MSQLKITGKLTQLTPIQKIKTADAVLTLRHLVVETLTGFVTFDVWGDCGQNLMSGAAITVHYKERPVVYDLPSVGFRSFVMLNAVRIEQEQPNAPKHSERTKVAWAERSVATRTGDWENNPVNW